jgi:hypothetical protein
MDRIRIQRRAIELKFKENRPVTQPRSRGFRQLLKGIKKGKQRWQEIEMEEL